MPIFHQSNMNESRLTLEWSRRRTLTACAIACALGISACGSEGGVVEAIPADSTVSTIEEERSDEGEHDDEGDEHDDEGDDHDDGDHSDEGSGGLDAHEHGSAEMTVAWIDSEVSIDMESPTQNVFGFEYEAESDEDLAVAADRTAALVGPAIITINDEADCELREPARTNVDQDGSHSEITVSWVFTCANADNVSEIDLTGLFSEFPGFEDVDVEWISASNQSSDELSPGSPTLSLEL